MAIVRGIMIGLGVCVFGFILFIFMLGGAATVGARAAADQVERQAARGGASGKPEAGGATRRGGRTDDEEERARAYREWAEETATPNRPTGYRPQPSSERDSMGR